MKITTEAIKFIENNIHNNLHVYIFVTYPFTKYAHVNINFCDINEIDSSDTIIYNDNFKIFIDKDSKKALRDATIDIKNNQLYINAPNIYELQSTDIFKDLKYKIKFLFENEINVMLSQHGGFIELVDLTNDNTLVIRFHGGCQGCGMIGYTLSNYIEKVIKKNFPMINKINDITAHDIKTNAYY